MLRSMVQWKWECFRWENSPVMKIIIKKNGSKNLFHVNVNDIPVLSIALCKKTRFSDHWLWKKKHSSLWIKSGTNLFYKPALILKSFLIFNSFKLYVLYLKICRGHNTNETAVVTGVPNWNRCNFLLVLHYNVLMCCRWTTNNKYIRAKRCDATRREYIVWSGFTLVRILK